MDKNMNVNEEKIIGIWTKYYKEIDKVYMEWTNIIGKS